MTDDRNVISGFAETEFVRGQLQRIVLDGYVLLTDNCYWLQKEMLQIIRWPKISVLINLSWPLGFVYNKMNSLQ